MEAPSHRRLWRGAMHAFQDPTLLAQIGPAGSESPFLSQATLTATYLTWIALWVVLVLGLAGMSFSRRDL